MAKKLGSLVLDVRTNTAKFVQGMETINKKIDGFSSKAKKLTATLAGLAGAAGFAALTRSVLQSGAQLRAYSQALGVSAKELSAWGLASKTVSIEQDKLNDILKDVSEKIGDAFANKGGEAVEVLKRLNINTKELVRLSPDKQLLAIANQLNNVGTQSEKIQILEALASDASLLLPLLDKNAKKFKEIRSAAENRGALISDADLTSITEANEKIVILEKTLSTKFAKTVAENADTLGNLADSFLELTDTVLKATGEIIDFSKESGKALAQFVTPSVTSLELQNKKIDETKKALSALRREQIKSLGKDSISEKAKEAEKEHRRLTLVLEKQLKLKRQIEEEDKKKKESDASSKIEEVKPKQKPLPSILGNTEQQEKFKEEIATRLETVGQFLFSEEESIRESYLNRQFIIENAFDEELISNERRNELLKKLEKKKEKEISEVQKKGFTDREKFARLSTTKQTQHVLDSLIAMTQGVAQSNKTMFQINKVAAIANAIVNTYQGVSLALATYPAPISFAMAAAVAAAGFAQVSAIKSTSFGGGGVAPSVAASGASSVTASPIDEQVEIPDAVSSEPSKIVTINIQGENVSSQQVRQLIEQINEEIGDGAELKVS